MCSSLKILCANSNNVSLVFCFFILILLWWEFMSVFAMFLHIFCHIALFPNCFTVFHIHVPWWLYYLWLIDIFVFISLISASMSLKCPCLCNWANWSSDSLNLSFVCGWIAFVIPFLWWSSLYTGVVFICLLVPVIMHPILVTLYSVAPSIVLLWSMPKYSSMHLQSSHCIATVDPVGIKGKFLPECVSLCNWSCLFISTIILLSSLSHNFGGVLSLGTQYASCFSLKQEYNQAW